MRKLNVIGCGNVGGALARLWSDGDVLQVQSILNRSLESGRRAAEFVGAGTAVSTWSEMGPAEVVMISVGDEAIEACCREMVGSGTVGRGTTVFHLSGSLSSELLEPAQQQGAAVASVHPVKSFADPGLAADTFAGTYCAIEGDPPACRVLGELFQRLGARPFHVDLRSKTIYHAATVFVCNYLVALMEVGLRCFDRAGVPAETAMQVMEPIVTGTVENMFQLGPVRALTGPIARGELLVVQTHLEALAGWDQEIQRLYKRLGGVAVELARARGTASEDALKEIDRLLGL